MKVKLLTVICGPDGTFKAGEIVEDTGGWLDGGYAERIDGSTDVKVEIVAKVDIKSKPLTVSKDKSIIKKTK